MNSAIDNLIRKNQSSFYQVVKFDAATDKLRAMDFTESNTGLTSVIMDNTDKFCAYIDKTLAEGNFLYGVGGYNELRTVYNRSRVFDAPHPGAEPRRLHLGTDIWGKAGTPVYAYMGGMIHSYAFNEAYGDYGATIVTSHQLDAIPFYTLYGHLSLRDIESITSGQYITRGEVIGHFGNPEENGHWPPHLHFQLIMDMELYEGDYPGVCRYSEREKYLSNCPNPDLVLMLNQYTSHG